MSRNYLTVGDRSSAGGTVTEGIPQMQHMGKQVTFVGATVTCPACNSTGPIVAQGPRWPGSVMGKQLALDGDLCACKCYPLPKMISGQTTMTMGFESNGSAAPAHAAPVDSGHDSAHWIRFELKERGNCEGMQCRATFADGSTANAVVDANNRVVFHRANATPCKALDILTNSERHVGEALTTKLLNLVGVSSGR